MNSECQDQSSPQTNKNQFFSPSTFIILPKAKSIDQLNRRIIVNNQNSHRQYVHCRTSSQKYYRKLEINTPERCLTSNSIVKLLPEDNQKITKKYAAFTCLPFVHFCTMFFKKKQKRPKFNFNPDSFIASQTNPNIPFVLELLVGYTEQYFLHVKGIYRLSGSQTNLMKQISMLNKDPKKWTFESNLWTDGIFVSCLFKIVLQSFSSYFPLKVMTHDLISLYRTFPENFIFVLCTKIVEFNTFRRTMLLFVLRHFSVVVQKSAVNKMDAKSLGIVFGPILFDINFPRFLDHEVIHVIKDMCEMTGIMINQFSQIEERLGFDYKNASNENSLDKTNFLEKQISALLIERKTKKINKWFQCWRC